MPASRQLPKGAGLVYIHGGDDQGKGFKGCLIARARLYLILQGKLDTRQKAPFDRIKGTRSPCYTLQFFIPYPLNSKVPR
jgi:hypothetical protein